MKSPEEKQLDADLMKAKLTGKSLAEIRRDRGLFGNKPMSLILQEETKSLTRARIKLAREINQQQEALRLSESQPKVKQTKRVAGIHYDLDFKKPRGTRKRESEVVRIYKRYFKPEAGKTFNKTLVIAKDGSIYEAKKDSREPSTSIFDWSRRWTCIGHVGQNGIDSFVMSKLNEGWFYTDEKYAGSNSRHNSKSEGITPLGRIKPMSLLDIIKNRQVAQSRQVKLEDNEKENI